MQQKLDTYDLRTFQLIVGWGNPLILDWLTSFQELGETSVWSVFLCAGPVCVVTHFFPESEMLAGDREEMSTDLVPWLFGWLRKCQVVATPILS